MQTQPWIYSHESKNMLLCLFFFLKKDLELGSWLIHQIKLNQLATLI